MSEMKRLGYESKYEVLNAYDFGIPQKRERIFVISYLGRNLFDFGSLQKTEAKHLSEFLETEVGELYEVKQESMLKMLNPRLNYKPNFRGRLKVITDFAYTVSTKQVRVPNAGIIDIGSGKYRYLTERECFRLMGFSDSDFDTVSSLFPRRKTALQAYSISKPGTALSSMYWKKS